MKKSFLLSLLVLPVILFPSQIVAAELATSNQFCNFTQTGAGSSGQTFGDVVFNAANYPEGCVIYENVNGVSSGNLTIDNTTLVLHKTLTFDPNQKIDIINGGLIWINTGGLIKQIKLCVKDADNDLYADTVAVTTDPNTGLPLTTTVTQIDYAIADTNNICPAGYNYKESMNDLSMVDNDVTTNDSSRIVTSDRELLRFGFTLAGVTDALAAAGDVQLINRNLLICTAGSCPTTNFTADSGSLYVAGNVGIGIASPLNALNIQSATSPQLGINYSTTPFGPIGATFGVDANGNTTITSVKSGATSTNGSILIPYSNVGIGTTNPGARLEVAAGSLLGNSAGNELAIATLKGRTDDIDYLRFYLYREDNVVIPPADWQTATWKIQRNVIVDKANVNIGYIGLGNSISNLITFGEGTTEYMRIDGGGKVGIGTTYPGARLEVAAGSLGTTDGNELAVTTLYGLTPGNFDYLRFYLDREGAGTDWQTANWKIQRRVDASNMGYISLGNHNSNLITFGEAATEYARIDGSGNLYLHDGQILLDSSSGGQDSIDSNVAAGGTKAGGSNALWIQSRFDDVVIQAGVNDANNRTITLRGGTTGLGLVVLGNGSVGVGTTNPTAKLTVSGYVSRSTGYTFSGAGGNAAWTTGFTSQNLNTSIAASNVIIGAGIYSVSDKRLKHNIADIPLNQAEKFISTVNPVSFNWNDTGNFDTGFIAQDLISKGFGHLVGTIPNETLEETTDSNGVVSPKGSQYVVNYDSIVPILTTLVKKHETKINEQQNQIDAMKSEINDLQNRLQKIENSLSPNVCH